MRKLFSLPEEFGHHILAGPSVCVELVASGKSVPYGIDNEPLFTKIPTQLDYGIGGTSFNIVHAMQKIFGLNSFLVATVSHKQADIFRMEIDSVLTTLGLNYHLVPAKKGTAVGIIIVEPGKRTRLQSVKPLYAKGGLEQTHEAVRKQIGLTNPAIIAATGITLGEAEIAKVMFITKADSMLVLNPRTDLIRDEKEFSRLLKHNPLLIINQEELAAWLDQYYEKKVVTAELLNQLHDKGADNIIITFAEAGAIFSNSKKGIWIDQPALAFGKAMSTSGAGDLFLVGFLSAIIDDKTIKEAMMQGAVLSGLKVLKRGSWHIPSQEVFAAKMSEICN